jgi:hypothetical protein
VKCHNTISVDFIQGLLLRISKLLMHCVCFNGDLPPIQSFFTLSNAMAKEKHTCL